MTQIAVRKDPIRRGRACAVAVALLVGAGVVACGDDGGSAASSGSTTPAASGATSASSGATGSTGTDSPVSVMNQVKFVNAQVRVAAGTSVVFDNQDSQAHTAISDDNGAFDTGLIQPGTKASVKFDKPGTFAYHCSLHPFMKAQIVVT